RPCVGAAMAAMRLWARPWPLPYAARLDRARLQGIEEIGDGRPEAVEVDQERVMALRRLERQEMRLGAAGTQAVGDLLLLLQREQDVGVHADRQRPLHPDPRQSLVGRAA